MICRGCKHYRGALPWIKNFAVAGCTKLKIKFGLASDLRLGKSDKSRGIVAVPRKCNDREKIC